MTETAVLIFTSGYVDRMPESLLDSGLGAVGWPAAAVVHGQNAGPRTGSTPNG